MFLTINMYSAALERRVSLSAVLPDGAHTEIPTLYLLHGLSDDYMTWSCNTSLRRYAEARGIAVICPNGDTSFYSDTVGKEAYLTFVARELVAATRAVFPLSHDRDKTWIAGNSMGGYGAVKAAFTRPETFGAAVTYSGALDIVSLVRNADWMQALSVRNWGKDCHTAIAGSGDDLQALLGKFEKDASLPKPRLLQICGTEDFLYEENQTFRRWMENAVGFDYTYREYPGDHTWPFWDAHLPEGMDWLMCR